MRKYTTSQGDMWDIISLKVYNTEKLMHILIDANPQYRHIVVFPANCELFIPEASAEETTVAPPWKRNTTRING